MAGILGKAIENEKIAGERYQALAEETADPAGQDMFRELANEEQIHQRILEDEFFSLSNQGRLGLVGDVRRVADVRIAQCQEQACRPRCSCATWECQLPRNRNLHRAGRLSGAGSWP